MNLRDNNEIMDKIVVLRNITKVNVFDQNLAQIFTKISMQARRNLFQNSKRNLLWYVAMVLPGAALYFNHL